MVDLISALNKVIQLYIYNTEFFHILFHYGLSQDIDYNFM